MMDGMRRLVVLIILIALSGGIFARFRFAASDLSDSQFEVRTPNDADGFHFIESFITRYNSLRGYRISLTRCSQPYAALPVATGTMVVAPAAHSFSGSDLYSVSYIFNGHNYPEDGIGPRLVFLRMLYRLESAFGLTDAGSYAFYLKIWSPLECGGLSADEAAALQRLLIGKVQPKPSA
jgi:hypothetical protein